LHQLKEVDPQTVGFLDEVGEAWTLALGDRDAPDHAGK
jgi:hypothetical protein